MKELFQAAEVAANARESKKTFFLGCVALRKDGVLVKSTNINVVENMTPSAHAEARALRKAGKNAVIWVARVLKDKKTWAQARPCPTCRALIVNRKVAKVYYTIGPGEYGIWIPGNNDALVYGTT